MNKKKGRPCGGKGEEQVYLALRRTAWLFHFFTETLIRELGEVRGRRLVRQTIDAYGNHIGENARRRAEQSGLSLTPENYNEDLPDSAWSMERVIVAGEERIRVHRCPFAEEWKSLSDPANARLYCFVDQAKMRGFNPEYETIHIRNILDGDAYCEMVVRPRRETLPDAEEDSGEESRETVKWVYGRYTREDLMRMNPACLRALFRERIHHTLEVPLYPILLGEKKMPADFGRQVELILDVWRRRGLPLDAPDIVWGQHYLQLAAQLRSRQPVQIPEEPPQAFSGKEMMAVRKLIWNRRSIRDWIPGKPISKRAIDQILEAGRAAPTACNLEIVRFLVISGQREAGLIWSDIPTPMDRCILIVVCYDHRIYPTIGHDRLVPHNQLFDCAAAADHMCLMAHALGLGAVWLTSTSKTAREFKERYPLPEHLEPALHIAVGWPARGSVKSARMPLEDMMVKIDPGE